MSDGQITIVGTMGRDPELKFTATGRALCSFVVAVSHRYKPSGSDEWVEETSWMDVTAWGTLGENAAASLAKGNRVLCTGRLKQDSWTDKETGKERQKHTMVADAVGPDLRWARVTVEKLERTSSNE